MDRGGDVACNAPVSIGHGSAVDAIEAVLLPEVSVYVAIETGNGMSVLDVDEESVFD
jgi:hypothetical protein